MTSRARQDAVTITYAAGLDAWDGRPVTADERQSWLRLVAACLARRYPHARIVVELDGDHSDARLYASDTDTQDLGAILSWLHTTVWSEWCAEHAPSPPRRHHATQPEAARAAKMVLLRMRPEIRRRLDALARSWGLSRSATVTRLVVMADGKPQAEQDVQVRAPVSMGRVAYDAYSSECRWLLAWNSLTEDMRLRWCQLAQESARASEMSGNERNGR